MAALAAVVFTAAAAIPATAQTTPEAIYNSGSFPASLAQTEIDADPTGTTATYSPGGGVADLSQNAFFSSAFSTNGRSCATCHQPPSAMGLSLANIQARYTATGGTDPLFATIDAATCPNKLDSSGKPDYSLLLSRGLVRAAIALPVTRQFTITVLNDPYGCNTNPQFNQTVDPTTGQTVPVISVYRRPSPAANLPFVINPIPAERGAPLFPPALNWDGRATSLTAQATEAVTRHFQAGGVEPPADQIAAMVAFESGVYSAQLSDSIAGSLTAGGALGGPQILSTTRVGQFEKLRPSLTNYFSWFRDTQGTAVANQRLSVNRGENIFNSRTFLVSNVDGIPNEVKHATCEFCHSQAGAGNDPTGQRFLLGVGVEGSAQAFGGPAPSPQLPTFQVTCKGAFTTQHLGSTIITSDLGKAMTSGLCIDIAKFKIPPIRGLAARAPYFFDGSAATLMDVVNFYDTRFNIGLSAQDKQDLVNFLSVL